MGFFAFLRRIFTGRKAPAETAQPPVEDAERTGQAQTEAADASTPATETAPAIAETPSASESAPSEIANAQPSDQEAAPAVEPEAAPSTEPLTAEPSDGSLLVPQPASGDIEAIVGQTRTDETLADLLPGDADLEAETASAPMESPEPEPAPALTPTSDRHVMQVHEVDMSPTLPSSLLRATPLPEAAPPPPVMPAVAPLATAAADRGSEEPARPGNRRERITDPRLDRKPPTARRAGPRRSKRLIVRDEAARLFSATLRTRDRAARVLATDEAQLERYGLPVWRSEAEVALALDVSLKTLRHFSMHSAQECAPHYVTFAIPKRTGGERLIMAPKRRLKALQRKLNALLCAKLPASENAHGFRPGHSVRTNAQPHVGRGVVLKLDIRDFFPSIHFGRVRGLLLSMGYGYPVASVLAALMTEPPRQPIVVGDKVYHTPVGSRACPQGAPTSPQLSNALLLKLDRRVAGLARQLGFEYTRYADDLTLSGDDVGQAHALRLGVTRIVEEEGFRINTEKTRIVRAGSCQRVTGVVVNDVLGLSRQTRRRMRAALHQWRLAQANGQPDPAVGARLMGEVAWVHMLNPEQARKLKG
jgi:retron-type reverse transcriptase